MLSGSRVPAGDFACNTCNFDLKNQMYMHNNTYTITMNY